MRKGRSTAIGQVGLFPSNQMATDDLASVVNDKDFLVNIRSPRNIQQLRKGWALAQKLADSCEWLHDREDAMDYLKLRARHVKYLREPNGNVQIIPKSISFASLPQNVFNRIFNRMIWVVCNEIIPGMKESELRKEIERMCTS
jgi:hypothetical protein